MPKEHILARIEGVYNAVCVSGDVVGTTVLIGRGAGQDATASAVIGDIADAVFTLQGAEMQQLSMTVPTPYSRNSPQWS